MWYLIDSLVSLGFHLQNNKISHGDIRPANINLTPEGFVKLADHGLFSSASNNYYKSFLNKERTFLAPNLLKSLAIRENRPFYDFWKGDIYSLGMTILEVTTFGNCYNCYDWNNYIIINQFIEELLK